MSRIEDQGDSLDPYEPYDDQQRNQPETRNVHIVNPNLKGRIERLGGISQQQAIARCITHNLGGLLIDDQCVAGAMSGAAPDVCVISRGGPDHKWWKDA